MYGGIVRLMGDVLVAIVLMEVTPYSANFFILLIVKFIGRLVIDLDFYIYFPSYIYEKMKLICCKLKCCSNATPTTKKKTDQSTSLNIAAMADEFYEQIQLGYLSLISECTSLSAIFVIFCSTFLLSLNNGSSSNICTSTTNCPSYQPLLNVPLFVSFISCNKKMISAMSSYLIFICVCGLRIAIQNSLFDRRFRRLPILVQLKLLKVASAEIHSSSSKYLSGNSDENDIKKLKLTHLLTQDMSNAHTMSINSNGTLILVNKHQRWRILTAVSITVQILYQVSLLNIRPFGVAPTTWSSPSISFLCDKPINMSTVQYDSTLRAKALTCDGDDGFKSTNRNASNSTSTFVQDIMQQMIEYKIVYPHDDMSCCGILMNIGKETGEQVRTGIAEPEPEPEPEPNDDGTVKKPIACSLYDGWLYNKSSSSSSSSYPKSEPEPER